MHVFTGALSTARFVRSAVGAQGDGAREVRVELEKTPFDNTSLVGCIRFPHCLLLGSGSCSEGEIVKRDDPESLDTLFFLK